MKNRPYFRNRPKHRLPDNLTTGVLQRSQSLEFHSSLEEYSKTPLVSLDALAQRFQVQNIYLKDESFRFGLNAFKGLGASYAIYQILKQEPEITTFCTATDGNHGRAVAWSAKQFGKKALVFVPRETTRARIEAIRKEGATVEQLNANYEEATTYAEKVSRKENWRLVQDASWENYEEIPAQIMAGYLTHFRELENSLHQPSEPGIDVVFLQAGVGSWPAAAAWYYQNRYADKCPKLVIVEPKESSGILESFRQGNRCAPTGNYDTMMAGLNCGIPSLNAWEILKETASGAMEIEDHFAREAMRLLHYPQGEDPQVISGESGAGGLAGFIALMRDDRFRSLREKLKITRNSRILVYSTEGATDPENFYKMVGMQ